MKKECIILIGKSASGKTTLLDDLCDNNNYHKLITTTTRTPRVNEKENIDYFFTNNEIFEKMIEKNELLEYIKFENNYYGLTKKAFDNIPQNKKPIVILDPEGAKNTKIIMEKEGWKITTVFVDESLDNIIDRINKRDDPIKNKKRIENVLNKEKNWDTAINYDLVLKKDTSIEDRKKELLNFIKPKKNIKCRI